MRLILTCFLFAICFLVSAQKFQPIEEQSKVTFEIKNFGSTVDGNLKGLKGTILFNENDIPKSTFHVTVDANTINTDIKMRDNHLRKDAYLNVEEFPLIRFVSTKVTSDKPGYGLLTGKLTIKKTTKEIIFPFTYTMLNGNMKFVGEFLLNRRDYEVGGNSISLSDELTVSLIVLATSKN